MEPMTTFVGLAVGKAVFKAWFKDNEFASSASESAVDLIRSTISDGRARSAAERQLSRISERAADTLEPFIQYEWGDLPKHEKIEAINVVQNGIDGININSSLMAALDYSTDRLVALVLSSLQTGALSHEATRLAQTLAHEAAQMISDLASSMPEFHTESYAEILRREGDIIDRLDRVFSEIENIRKSSSREVNDASNTLFEQTYRRAVGRELDQIELFGLDSGIRQSSRQHSLSTAYISLTVNTGADGANDNDDSETDNNGDVSPDNGSAFSVRAEEAANLSRLVVIKGEAGSGKTTLLQSLAVGCATASYSGEMEEWNQLIPFFVRLRALSGASLPAPEDLPGLITPNVAGMMPPGWVHHQFAAGRVVLLVDGLDEVSFDRRDQTRKWITSILQDFPDTRVVVTSRPTAIPDGWLSQQSFKQLELLPMSPDDVSAFINHWHEAVANEEQDRQRRDQVLSLVPTLKERIRTDRALRELAATPLLCAMLCAMNRDRKQVLPTNRIALYDAAVQMILHGRDEQRQIKFESLVRLNLETKQAIIQEIAFWMMQNGTSMADNWRVEDFISTLIPSFTNLNKELSSKQILATLIQRSGVIRSPIEGKVDFVHNAFKEYLCAKAVSAGDRFGFLTSMLSNEAWREVAVLAVAMTDERRRAEFVRGILATGDKNLHLKATYHLLAVRCLETCTQLESDLQREIRSRLSGLSAPSSLTEARSLSAAGDMALPLLSASPRHLARTAASCVRALRLIGTQDALANIADYATDYRATVAKEVAAAWPFFDTVDYARDVLSRSSGIYGNIRVEYPDYLRGVRYLTSTLGLNVSLRRASLPDWAIIDIGSLKQLRRLYVSCDGVLDASKFAGMTNLGLLLLSSTSISNVEHLTELNELYRLSLSGKIAQPISLEHLPDDLTSLQISGSGSMLVGAPRAGNVLEDISIGEDAAADDFEFLANCTQLASFAARSITSDSELANIFRTKTLERIKLYSLSNARAIPSSSGLPNLRSLELWRAEDLEDISGLSAANNITDLIIRGAPNLRNISVLAKLANLNHLTLDIAAEADLTCLEELPDLRLLTLSRQHANSVPALSKSARRTRVVSSVVQRPHA